ncbi:MAG: DNA internalization-related competence protein ComEC/Rec2 [Balneolaceae bacterium]
MKEENAYQLPFAKIPALKTAALFMTGIAAGKVWDITYLLSVFLFLIILLIWLLFENLYRSKLNNRFYTLALIAYLLFISFAGLLRFQLYQYSVSNEKEEVIKLLPFASEHLRVKGELIETGITGTGRQSILLLVNETVIENKFTWKKKYLVQLYSQEAIEILNRIKNGDRIEGVIRLYAKSEKRNPHEFDFNEWLERKNIFLQGSLESITHHEKVKKSSIWTSVRSKVQEELENQYSEDIRPVAKALLTGYKKELTNEERLAFSRSGLSHVMAVSGLHVGFIVAPFWIIIPWFWKYKSGKWIGLFILTVLLLMYAGVTGFSVSVCRASLMAWLFTYSRLFHKTANSFNLLGVAALILMWINPSQISDVGFQLSFSAVFIILLIMPIVTNLIPDKFRYGRLGKISSILLISIVVQAGLFPILVFYFGEFSVSGPIANSVVIPFLAAAIPAGTLLLGISSISGVDLNFFVQPVEWIFIWTRFVANHLSQTGISYLAINPENITLLIMIWISGTAFIASIRISDLRWKFLTVLLILLNIHYLDLFIKKLSPAVIKVTLLDVSQGDAIHVETPYGKHILIDTGRWSPFSNSGDRILIPYLKYNGINRLDAVFLSHPHSDHIGGMPALIQAVPINKIYTSGYEYTSALYKNYRLKAEKKGIQIRGLQMGDIVEIDPSIRIYVLSPEADFTFTNPNNHSIVLKIVYGNTSFLFTGDAEHEQEALVSKRYKEWLKSDFMKIGHHGSRTSSTEILLNYVMPQKAAASLAYRNVFGHPHPEAVTRLQENNIKLGFTSLEGAYILQSDGNQLKRISWK